VRSQAQAVEMGSLLEVYGVKLRDKECSSDILKAANVEQLLRI